MSYVCVNLACGDTYINSWRNFDFSPHSSAVCQVDLLNRFPLGDCTVDVLYSSHFFEHIPRNNLIFFINECFRVMKPGGSLRFVLPDLEYLAAVYLNCRKNAEHEKADFLILEMFDQCVRRVSGGELRQYYSDLQYNTKNNIEMINFIKYQVGYDIKNTSTSETTKKLIFALKSYPKLKLILMQIYCNIICMALPKSFKDHNVSTVPIGEKHTWMYDFYSVEKLLTQINFQNVKKMSPTKSNILNFPFFPLDLNEDGLPRKGNESMYIEAIKPYN